MGEVQDIVEEVSRSQVLGHAYHASFHYGITFRYTDVARCFCRGTTKIKTVGEVWELIDIMSLNEYRAHTYEEASPRKKGMIDLNTHDALLASNKLLSLQLQTIAKKVGSKRSSHTVCMEYM